MWKTPSQSYIRNVQTEKREGGRGPVFHRSQRHEGFLQHAQDSIWVHSSSCSPLLFADWNTLIAKKEMILESRAEHFNSVLNHLSAFNAEAIIRVPQVPTDQVLADSPIKGEVEKAVQHLSWCWHDFSRNLCLWWITVEQRTRRAVPVHVDPGRSDNHMVSVADFVSL